LGRNYPGCFQKKVKEGRGFQKFKGVMNPNFKEDWKEESWGEVMEFLKVGKNEKTRNWEECHFLWSLIHSK